MEQPELEERHHGLVASIATDQNQLLDIEDQILRLLNHAGSGVEVLDDEVPILMFGKYAYIRCGSIGACHTYYRY